MAHEDIAAAERLTLTGRVGSSRKLLQRKALQKVRSDPASDPLEDSFPLPDAEALDDIFPAPAAQQQEQERPEEPQSASSSAPAAAPAQPAAAPPAWSSEDEAALQTLLARRRAAGYQRRGKDVGAQQLRPGSIKPNPDTVVATIVGIVTERGELGRAELLDLMAEATFPHPSARPQDKGWCQGYVAGAIRSGFLAVVAEPSTAGSEPSATVGEEG